jgi:hypothetical protein
VATTKVDERSLQKTKAPDITPLAIAVGKTAWARLVNGYDRAKNKSGGMTNRSLNDCCQHNDV